MQYRQSRNPGRGPDDWLIDPFDAGRIQTKSGDGEGLTIGVGVGEEDGVDVPKPMTRKHLQGRAQEALSTVDQDRPEKHQQIREGQLLRVDRSEAKRGRKEETHDLEPSGLVPRTTALVLRRMFLLPSGSSVDKQVLHGGRGESDRWLVKQETFGSWPDVPVGSKGRKG